MVSLDNWISTLRSQSFELVEIVTSEYENIYCNDNIEMSSCSVIDSESLLQIKVVTHFLSDILINHGWWLSTVAVEYIDDTCGQFDKLNCAKDRRDIDPT